MVWLIDKIKEAHGLVEAKHEKGLADSIISGFGIGGTESAWGDQESLNKVYEKITWVYRCVSIIAWNIARVNLRVVRGTEGKEVDITDRPEFRILRKPNKFQTRHDFMVESISRLMMQGEMFWELEFNGARLAQMFADWRSEEVEVVGDPGSLISQYKRTVNGKVLTFKPEEIFYVKFFNPFSILRGMSPLRAARSAVTLDLNAVTSNTKFFRDGMKLSGVFTTDQRLTEPEAKRLTRVLKDYFGGVEKAWEPGVLWGGMKFQPLNNMTLRDAEFIQMREMNREEIAAAFGVPLEVLGIGKATFENVKFARRMFWTETLIPLLDKLTALLNEFFLPIVTPLKDVRVKYDLSDVEALKEDRTRKRQDFEAGFKVAAVTPNDIRTQVFGLAAIDNPAMNSTYLPLNFQPVATATSKALRIKASAESHRQEKRLTYEQRTKIWQEKVNKLEPKEGKFKNLILKLFDKQWRDVKKRLLKNKAVKNGFSLSDIFDFDKWVEEFKAAGEPLIAETVMAEIAAWTDEAFEAIPAPVFVEVGERARRFSKFVNETTANEIQAVLREGLEQNLGVNEMAELIRSRVFDPSVTAMRAQRIARTEVFGATNFGTQKGIELGDFPRKMWITSRDEKVRESHQIDGQVVGVDEMFTLADGDQMPYPQDINERCIHIGTTEPKTI